MKLKIELPKRKDELLKSFVLTLLALFVLAILLFPVYYMAMLSVKPSGTLATTEIDLIPDKVTFSNYRDLIFGHTEGLIKTTNFEINAKKGTIKDSLNRYEIELHEARIVGSYSSRFTLIDTEILERKGGEERQEPDGTQIIVRGESIKLNANQIESTGGVKNLKVSAQKVIITLSSPNEVPLDLSKFTKIDENTYEAQNVEMEIKDGGIVRAEEATFTATNFAFIRLAKVGGEVPDYMKRSLLIASLTVILTLLFVIPSAYAFSRLKFFGREHVLYFYLMFTQVAGGLGIAGLVALYGMLVKLHLTNNIFVLPVIYAAGAVPFNTWLLKSYLDSIPPDFDEAALVDGAGYLQIIRHVLIPMALPGLATVAIFAFIGGWTELILANLLLNQENYPLTVWLYTMLANLRSISWNQFAAAALVFALPVFIMFLLAQNYVRSGLTLGGLKE
ncbi:malg sugar transport inner membrane protein [Thermococcus litoralis DSM 5473]|uniref:Malg sugar transport inner membrane protein n=1 Tax=Thermococcus litoralis (strain ATCC 51850 / DSM 5473 / JCM 8560 / NS-C) TaxID=523849 RepID=H3ZKJ1_THELN|nr:ABC transporter permease subunit [Thermococcus litoralis]EHR79593.1 malg sugar transport inner membrane protein [Thermococcus litoralis DSM 5473]